MYIGSAIYTAGIKDVQQVFGVSQVAATLGLTLFVAGYGIGPMYASLLTTYNKESPLTFELGYGPL